MFVQATTVSLAMVMGLAIGSAGVSKKTAVGFVIAEHVFTLRF